MQRQAFLQATARRRAGIGAHRPLEPCGGVALQRSDLDASECTDGTVTKITGRIDAGRHL